jgi:hypothetical protein
MFHIPYTKLTTRDKMAKLTSKLRGGQNSPAKENPESEFEDYHPAIVIVKGQETDILFRWTGENYLWNQKNGKKLESSDIMRVVNYCTFSIDILTQ